MIEERVEAELRVALAEGVLSKEEVDALRGEALRQSIGPLELLRARGRISEDSLSSLIAHVRDQSLANLTPSVPPTLVRPVTDPDATRSLDVKALSARVPESPVFPMVAGDRYQPVRFLGQGGMGQVFLAYDLRLQRNVALKFVRGEDSALSHRFINEARAQARVNHDRVCKVYEVGEAQGRIFIAMQYIDGQSLNVLGPKLSFEQRAMVVRDAALGVHEAHRVGLIHRDLKPSNIMVEETTLRSYVMDFGLARDWHEGVTAEGSVLGTPHFM